MSTHYERNVCGVRGPGMLFRDSRKTGGHPEGLNSFGYEAVCTIFQSSLQFLQSQGRLGGVLLKC